MRPQLRGERKVPADRPTLYPFRSIRWDDRCDRDAKLGHRQARMDLPNID
jgi:hypothetical protein